MPTISCGFVNRPGRLVAVGPLVSVEIGYDPDFRPNAGLLPAIPAMRYNALLDTGASATGIDVELADYLNLPVIGESGELAGALGVGQSQEYRAVIQIPELNVVFNGPVIGVRLSAGRQPYDAIIGRDFLRRLRLVYDGPSGEVTISSD